MESGPQQSFASRLDKETAYSLLGSPFKKRVQACLRSLKAKAINLTALVCFCAASFPLPIAVPQSGHIESSQAFPCQKSSCGCKSAHQCWTHCCCMSPKQRFEWAEKNGVTPPSYATKPTTETTIRSVAKKKESSCCPPSQTIETQEGKLVGKKSCCSEVSTTTKTKTAKPSKNTRFTLTILALKCQGQSTPFTMLPWTILTTNHALCISAEYFWPLSVVAAPNPAIIFSQPDTPPPRL